MNDTSTINRNLSIITEIVKKSPATTHINFRREDDVVVDVPLSQASWTVRQYPEWTVEDGAFPEASLQVARGAELPVLAVPPKPSEEVAAPLPVKEDVAPLEDSQIREGIEAIKAQAEPIDIETPTPSVPPKKAVKKVAAKKKAK